MKSWEPTEDLSAFYAASRGVPARAGIYLLDDAFHVAGPGTTAEARLLARGAIPVASVTFDGSGGEGPPPADVHAALALRDLRRLPVREAVRTLRSAPSAN